MILMQLFYVGMRQSSIQVKRLIRKDGGVNAEPSPTCNEMEGKYEGKIRALHSIPALITGYV